MKFWRNLQPRLAMLVVAAIIPLLVLSMLKAWLSADAAVSRANDNLRSAVSLVAASQAQVESSAHQILMAIAHAPGLVEGKVADCQRYFKTLNDEFAVYVNLGLIGLDGYFRCDGVARQVFPFAGDREYFKAALASRNFTVSNYMVGRVTGKPVITFAMPVINGDGKLTAVTFASIDVHELYKAVTSVHLPPGSHLLIMDREGTVLTANPDMSAVIGRQVVSPLLQEAIKSMRTGVGQGPDAEGLQRLYAFQPAVLSGHSPFFVALSVDLGRVVAPALKQWGLESLVLGLGAFLGGWLAWMLGGRAIVGPAGKILEATQHVQSGQLDVRIPRMPHAVNEFARMAEGFNHMAETLQARDQALGVELERSHQAFSMLELTMNSMSEGMVAVDPQGHVLLANAPARKIFSEDGRSSVLSRQWAEQQGLFVPGTETPFPVEGMPLGLALKGETGTALHLFVRNEKQPQGLLLSCSYHPICRDGAVIGALCVFSDITQVDQLQREQLASYNQLRETQRKLLDAQRLGRIGSWELDIKAQKLWVSDEVLDLYGVPPGTFDHNIRAYRDLMHPDDLVRYLAQRAAAFDAGLPIDVEYRITTPAGEQRWIHQFDRLQTDATGQVSHRIGVVQEITERKRAELIISRTTELLKQTGAMAKVGGWEWAVDAMTPYCSEEIYRIHDLDPGADHGLDNVIRFYAPEVQPVIKAALKAALENATPWDLELPLITAKGRRIWVHTQGQAVLQGDKVVRLIGVLQDITEQRQSQDQLRLLETCISRLNDIVLITEAEPLDEPGPRIVFVNDAFERRTGYSRAEVLGKTPRILQGPKTDRAELDRIGAALRKWQPVRAELINYTKAGEEFWIELDIAPVADPLGRYTHWVAVARDITQRKFAERALVDSEHRYAALFNSAPVPMWVFDTDTKQFLMVNNAAVESYGYSSEEFMAMTLLDLRPKSDQKRLQQHFSGTVVSRREPWRHLRKDGSVFPVDVVSQPIQYAGRSARFVVALDVSAQTKAEKDVQEYLFTLQRAADSAQAITWHQTLEGTVQEVVEQARGVIGTHHAVVRFRSSSDSRQVISARSLSEKYTERRALTEPANGTGIDALVCENNRAVSMTQAELAADPRWTAIDGFSDSPAMRGWLAVPLTGRSGKNIGLLQMSDKYEGEFSQQDEYVAVELAQLASAAMENAQLLAEVSQLNAGLEQKVADRTLALARQEALFRALAEQAPQVVWTVDPNGAVRYYNRAWFDLVGGTLADWTGTQWFAVVHPEDLPEVRANWKIASATRSQYSGVRRLRAKDGSYHTMAYRASPVLDEHNEVAFWVGIDADITEIKSIEEALRLSNQELEAFSYSVSHDLRSPLNTIDGFSRLLAKQLVGHSSDKVQHYLARIQAGVGQMGQLIEDLLSLAQVSRMQLRTESVDLSALARSILEGWRERQPGRRVTVHIENDLHAQGDGRLFKVVMENLLGNAWKFTSQQAQAQISVGQTPDAAGLPVFFVRDNGAGFDMAYADKLFNPFQRLHATSDFPGTGVGLATVSRVINRHGGRVWADAAPGRGATFFFTLPKAAVAVAVVV